jgi:hypothetical protein
VAKKINHAAPPPARCGTLEEIQRYCCAALGVGDCGAVGAAAMDSDEAFFFASAAFAMASC